MIIVKENQIKKIVNNDRNYRLFTFYRQESKVQDLSVAIGDDGNYDIKAIVTNYGIDNKVRIGINLNGEVVNYQCDCKWCTKNSGCAHVGIVLEYLLKDEVNCPRFVNNEALTSHQKETIDFHRQELQSRSSSLLTNIQSNLKVNHFKFENEETIHLSCEAISLNQHLQLAFFIGQEKTYAIKDLVKFITRINNNEYFQYGKKLGFTHNLERFDEESKLIIQFIMNSIISNNDSASFNNKYIYVDEQNIDNYYDTFSQIEEKDFFFEESEEPINVSFRYDQNEELYQVFFEIDNLLIGCNNVYEIEYDQIVRGMFQQYPDALNILRVYRKEKNFSFTKEDIDKFVSILNSFPLLFNISGYQSTRMLEKEINVYLDVENDKEIELKLEYVYSDQIKLGFDPSNHYLSINALELEDFIKPFLDFLDEDTHLGYLLQAKDETYEFILKSIPQIQKIANVYLSQQIKDLSVDKHYHLAVNLSVNHDLLALDIDSQDLPIDELSEILKSYRRKRKFYRLKDGKLISLVSSDLSTINQLLMDNNVSLEQIDQHRITLPTYRLFSLNTFNYETIEVSRSTAFIELQDRITNHVKKKHNIPAHYDNILRSYQKEGIDWLMTLQDYGFGGILADDMGLGKTIQVLALLESMNPKGLNIVVCPSSLLLNWKDEAIKFSTKLKVICIMGTSIQREQLINNNLDVDLMVTSYDYLRRDIKHYEKVVFNYIVLDEAQYIKNQNTKSAYSVKKLQGQYRLALTGTPIENSIAELWSIFDFIMPNYLYNYHYFKNNYEKNIVKDNDEFTKVKLKRMIEPFILRRNKKDVLQDLPEKIEQEIAFEFNNEEHKLYYANLLQASSQVKGLLHGQVDKIAILALLTRLRQICCDARLVYENISSPSSKMLGCLDLIKQMIENNRKIIVFSSFTSILDLLAKELKKQEISFYQLVGSTTKMERKDMVDNFQSDDTKVFLISLKAGGTGLNITAASCVIHFDPWWNISAQNQATDRAYRIGQNRDVLVYKLIMKDSIEEKIVKMQEYKKDLSDSFIENNDGSLAQMDNDTILKLFE